MKTKCVVCGKTKSLHEFVYIGSSGMAPDPLCEFDDICLDCDAKQATIDEDGAE